MIPCYVEQPEELLFIQLLPSKNHSALVYFTHVVKWKCCHSHSILTSATAVVWDHSHEKEEMKATQTAPHLENLIHVSNVCIFTQMWDNVRSDVAIFPMSKGSCLSAVHTSSFSINCDELQDEGNQQHPSNITWQFKNTNLKCPFCHERHCKQSKSSRRKGLICI